MKIYKFAYSALALVLLVGCTNSVISNDDEEEDARREYSYELMFEEMFGEIDPEHTWGFSENTSRAFDSKADGSYRILVEDLAARAGFNITSTASDWDFNDLVLDVTKKSEHVDDMGGLTNYKISMTIQALGGTLPIYLEYTDKDGNTVRSDELHGKLGVSVSTMVNTGISTANPMTILMFGASVLDSNVSKMSAYIDYYTNFDIANIKILVGEAEVEMKAEKGKAPGKICVPTSIDWPKERQCITAKHDWFSQWVQDRNYTTWEYWIDYSDTPIDLDVNPNDPVEDWDDGTTTDIDFTPEIPVFSDSRAVDLGDNISVYWANVDAVVGGSISDIDWGEWDGWQIPTKEEYQEIIDDGNWERNVMWMVYRAYNGNSLTFDMTYIYATSTPYNNQDDQIYVFSPEMIGEWSYAEKSTTWLCFRLVHVK